MNKQEFSEALKNELNKLPQNEIDKSLAFYEELIDDRVEEGENEEDAVAALGSMDAIVESVYYDQSIPTLVKAKVKEKNKNTENKVLWIIILILTSPVWLPTGLSLLSAFVAFYLSIWSIVISLYIVVIVCICGGIAGIVAAVFSLFSGKLLRTLAILGLSFCMIGFGGLLAYPVFLISKGLVKLTGKFIIWIKSLFISNKD